MILEGGRALRERAVMAMTEWLKVSQAKAATRELTGETAQLALVNTELQKQLLKRTISEFSLCYIMVLDDLGLKSLDGEMVFNFSSLYRASTE